MSHRLNSLCYQTQPYSLCVSLEQREASSTSTSVSDVKVILNLAREQYLKLLDSTLPPAATCLTDEQKTVMKTGTERF